MSDIRLYHFNHPNGKILSALRKFKSDEELVAQGWTDNPEKVEEVKAEPVNSFTTEQIEEASPDALVGMVKALGFNVLTDDQLQAEIVKAGPGPGGVLDITSVTDAALVAEYDRRSGNANADLVSVLQERFISDPKAMNKEDLVVYGKEGFGLKLNMTMKESTLIGHISEALMKAQ